MTNPMYPITKFLLGALADRPAASSEVIIYIATDTGVTSYSDGTVWHDFGGPHGATHAPGASDDAYVHMGAMSGTRIENILRCYAESTGAPGNGTVQLNYLTPPIPLTVTSLLISVGNTAASGLTLARLGIYTVDGSGNLTLAAATADVHASGANIVGGSSNVAVCGATATVYSVPLSLAGDLSTPQTSYQLVRGTRYVYAYILYSSGSPTMPVLHQTQNSGASALMAVSPRLAGLRGSQTDLPTSITSAQVGNNGNIWWMGAQ